MTATTTIKTPPIAALAEDMMTVSVIRPLRLRPSTLYRQPFDFIDMPLAMRIAQWAHRHALKPLCKLERKYNQWRHTPDTPIYDMTMVYDHPDGKRQWAVRSANYQYRYAFLPQYRNRWESAIFSLLAVIVERRRPKVAYDIGANWGQHSLFLCSLPAFTGHIHAFEPIPATYDDLSHNVTEAGLAARITTHDTALSNASGMATMVIPKNVYSGCAHIVTEGNGYTVPKAPLDSLKLPMPDVIKIDVEGHELAVLQGAEASILKAEPAIIFENLFDRNTDAMQAPLAFLEKRGARLYRIDADADGTHVVLTPLQTGDRRIIPHNLNIFACFQPAEDYFRQ